MFLFIGTPELILVGVAVLLLFGADKIPHFARGLGKIIRQAKDARTYITDEISKGVNEVDQIKKSAQKATEKATEAAEENPSKKDPSTPQGTIKR